METEIEAKFLNIDKDKIRLKLQEVGAKLVHPEILMRRKVYEHPTLKQNDWFRVRDEGDKITLSYKRLFDRTLHGTKEISIEVSDFDKTCSILENSKLKYVSYQETKREKWQLGQTEITIDTWPWIPTFVEIEAATEDEVRNASEKLGFDWDSATHGSVETAYINEYVVTEEEIDDWPDITFSAIPEWLEKKRRPTPQKPSG